MLRPGRAQFGREIGAEPDIQHRRRPGLGLERWQQLLAPELLVTPAIGRDHQTLGSKGSPDGGQGDQGAGSAERAQRADHLPPRDFSCHRSVLPTGVVEEPVAPSGAAPPT